MTSRGSQDTERITLFSVSSQDNLRLLEPETLASFSGLSCFLCGSGLWRNGYRQRLRPVVAKLQRLKCRNPACKAHYTVYTSGILPGYRYNLGTISKLTSECLNSPSGIEPALRNYEHSRECLIEDGKCGGPDVSTLRRWVKLLSVPLSILFLFLSALKQSMAAANPHPAVVFLLDSLAIQFLTRPLAGHDTLSPTMPVTDTLNQANNVVFSQQNLNFYNQEHPP